ADANATSVDIKFETIPTDVPDGSTKQDRLKALIKAKSKRIIVKNNGHCKSALGFMLLRKLISVQPLGKRTGNVLSVSLREIPMSRKLVHSVSASTPCLPTVRNHLSHPVLRQWPSIGKATSSLPGDLREMYMIHLQFSFWTIGSQAIYRSLKVSVAF